MASRQIRVPRKDDHRPTGTDLHRAALVSPASPQPRPNISTFQHGHDPHKRNNSEHNPNPYRTAEGREPVPTRSTAVLEVFYSYCLYRTVKFNSQNTYIPSGTPRRASGVSSPTSADITLTRRQEVPNMSVGGRDRPSGPNGTHSPTSRAKNPTKKQSPFRKLNRISKEERSGGVIAGFVKGFFQRFKLSRSRRLEISTPWDPVHFMHVEFNSSTGEFTGLPKEWRQLLQEADIHNPEYTNPQAVMDIVRFYQEQGPDPWDKPSDTGESVADTAETTQSTASVYEGQSHVSYDEWGSVHPNPAVFEFPLDPQVHVTDTSTFLSNPGPRARATLATSSNHATAATIATTTAKHYSPNDTLQALTSRLARDAKSRTAFSNAFSGNEAQVMVNYLSMLLHKMGVLSREGTRILDLLCKLAKSAGVYPQCYILKGVEKEKDPFQGGGFADVYKGTHKGRNICLKVFRIYQQSNRTRILREAQRLCLVSPWMKSGNLGEYLEQHPDAPRFLLVQDIIDGLLYLHQMSVAHGDLKTQNVLISDGGRALLTDFGLSTIAMTTAGVTSTVAVGRTTAFTAPELIDDIYGDKPPTKESDVWSFGCLCLEVFAGRTPFHLCKKDVHIIRALQMGEKPNQQRGHDVYSSLDKWVQGMMEKCWETNPQRRPTFTQIRDILVANASQSDERPKASARDMDRLAFWEDMRVQSGIEVDYKRVKQLIRDVSTGSTVSEQSILIMAVCLPDAVQNECYMVCLPSSFSPIASLACPVSRSVHPNPLQIYFSVRQPVLL
ncbi:kinase-like protein [Macrolepiota fuliginosa MF-IS2]|uniref:non-specific serine/threonine protein kinase n=1 Tax=Macrolepiota fuliginosa MF-IS2 TaxID=1400762 RepID=A0A9P6BYP6_9AGAR|nr:kinase-like protein [Macrolepiota fuliginosa MF-IS2]